MPMSACRPTRREFLVNGSLAALASTALPRQLAAYPSPQSVILDEFSHTDVTLESPLHVHQLQQSIATLMELSDDSLLKPFRKMAGQPAPGKELGGWYLYDPSIPQEGPTDGFAPGATFGQWISALARAYAVTGDEKLRDRVLRLNQLYVKSLSGNFFVDNRFPAYCFDKLVIGLVDSHRYARDPDAFRILEETTNTAVPHLPGKAIEHGIHWRPGKTTDSWTWDESYTLAENLFIAAQQGAGQRYRKMGIAYIDEEYFGPLSEGRSNLAGRHAYSHVNALSSAMQAYFALESEKHLRAAKNAFAFLQAQSYATGGWGPNETLLAPDSDELFDSLTMTHASFETPCGAYGHMKLTRYLLRATQDSLYGDSMERVMYNTVLGALPLLPDGSNFYYSDYSFAARKVYHDGAWACCSGTLPQVAADYGINAYLRDARGIFVNLYIPSTVRWNLQGTSVVLRQKGNYPLESHVEITTETSRPQPFDLRLRIPSWAAGVTLSVNGRRQKNGVEPGRFVTVSREWKTGDRVDLELPLQNRLEPINQRHPDTVALLRGPLVLFAISEGELTVSRQQLLAASRVDDTTWRVAHPSGTLNLKPFTAIQNERYSTYCKAS